MKVILAEEIPSLGTIGDVVKVADGYARNYLIPQKKAMQATSKNIKRLEHDESLAKNKLDKNKKEAESIANKIEVLSCTITKQAGEEDKLFGSVTTMDIQENLKGEGIDIDRKKIVLDEPIKKLGDFIVPIKLHQEVTADLKVCVVKS